MTDLERLRARLARMAEPTAKNVGRVRMLGSAAKSPLAVAMQREIEETYLPRALTFLNDRAEKMVLHVRAGRVVAAIETPPPDPDWIGSELSSLGQPHRHELSEAIHDFLLGSTTLSVQSDLHAPDISLAITGLCPSKIFAPLVIVEPAEPSPSVHRDVADFLTRCENLATAWIWVRGEEVVDSFGAPSDIANLVEFANNFLADQAGFLTSEDRCVVFCAAGDGAEAILRANVDNDLIFMRFPADLHLDVLQVWNEVE